MKLRNRSYEDYGISKEESRYLLNLCRRRDEIVESCLIKALQTEDEVIREDLYLSLKDNLSYDKLYYDYYRDIFINKVDFYAHRRMVLYLFKKKLIEAKYLK